jgi:hypothetical protein
MGVSVIEGVAGAADVSLSHVRHAATWTVELRVNAAKTSSLADVSDAVVVNCEFFRLLGDFILIISASTLQRVCCQ